jgi:hypothetical protein
MWINVLDDKTARLGRGSRLDYFPLLMSSDHPIGQIFAPRPAEPVEISNLPGVASAATFSFRDP